MIATTLNQKLLERAATSALALAVALAAVLTSPPAYAGKKKADPPLLELEVRHGKQKLGVEILRKRTFEKIVNYSTIAKIQEDGRRFTQRTHTKLDIEDRVQQYNRWLDVKGASTRDIVFEVAGAWKLRTGDTTSGKFAITELSVKSPIVLLDARSPTLVSVAVDRAAGRQVAYVRVDDKSAGPLTVRVQDVVDPKTARRYKRYLLSGKKMSATVLRDDTGHTVYVEGPGAYTGFAKGFKLPKELQAAPASSDSPPAAPGKAPSEIVAEP